MRVLLPAAAAAAAAAAAPPAAAISSLLSPCPVILRLLPPPFFAPSFFLPLLSPLLSPSRPPLFPSTWPPWSPFLFSVFFPLLSVALGSAGALLPPGVGGGFPFLAPRRCARGWLCGHAQRHLPGRLVPCTPFPVLAPLPRVIWGVSRSAPALPPRDGPCSSSSPPFLFFSLPSSTPLASSFPPLLPPPPPACRAGNCKGSAAARGWGWGSPPVLRACAPGIGCVCHELRLSHGSLACLLSSPCLSPFPLFPVLWVISGSALALLPCAGPCSYSSPPFSVFLLPSSPPLHPSSPHLVLPPFLPCPSRLCPPRVCALQALRVGTLLLRH